MAINVFTDGASRGNPGAAGIGVAIYEDGKVLEKIGEYVGKKTNNQAEYMALIRALERLSEMGVMSANVFCDSEFMVKQMSGLYKVKAENIKPLYEQAMELVKGKSINFRWVPRADNALADSLANEGIDNKNEKRSNGKLSTAVISNLILDKSFFGKINCLKVQMSNDTEVYFHMGLLDEKKGSWSWEIVKMSDIELGEIVNLLRKEIGKCSFFHSFNDKKTQLWCNKSPESFSIKIGAVSKNMSVGEFEVLRVILEKCIEKKCFV